MGTVGAQFLSLLWWCLMWQSLRGSQKQMPMCPEQRTHPAEGSLSDRCNWEGGSLEVANFSQQKCRTAKRPRFHWRTCEEVRGRVQISIPQTVWILHRVHGAGARSCAFKNRVQRILGCVCAALGHPVSLWWVTLVVNLRASGIT